MKTRSTYTSISVLFAVIALTCAVAWIYIVRESYSMKIEIATTETNIENSTTRNEYLSSLKNVLENSKTDLALIDGKFISKDEIPGLIDLIDGKAQDLGVTLSVGSLNFDETATTFPRELKIHATGSGAWGSDIKFISYLESLPYASKINNLMLTAQKGVSKDGSNSWNFSADIIVYASN